MPASPARTAAFHILLRVEREQSYASELLHSSRFSELSDADHRLATELVMGILRWRSLLDRKLAAASSRKLDRLDPEILTALRLGVYQLQFLSRVPVRAAIFESVELVKAARKRSAASFVNAVLRKIKSSSAEIAFTDIGRCSEPNQLAEASAHPAWLIGRWVEHYGFEATRQICLHDQNVPGVAIHVDDARSADELSATGIQLAPGSLLSSARRILSGDIAKSQAYGERRISIQDEASQLVATLVGQGSKILDCCAAPGSKTWLLAQRNLQSTLFACELHPHRARLLRNLVRLPNVHVVVADAHQLPFVQGFDRVLADVPCSGTGTLARNPEIKWRLKPEDLSDLQSRQIAILKSALHQLAPGGRLVYSTCSLEREENEAVVHAVLGQAPGFLTVDCRGELKRLFGTGELAWNQMESLLDGPYLRTIPGRHPCDGFFAAIMQRE